MKKFTFFSIIYILIVGIIQYLFWNERGAGPIGYIKNASQAAMLFMIIGSYSSVINIKVYQKFELKAIVALVVAFSFEYAQKFGAFKVTDPVTKKMSATYDINDLIAYAVGISISYVVMKTLKKVFLPDE